jgi:hypothetical protein
VRAYKFLQRDGTTLLTGFKWPVGEWVEVDGVLAWCGNGIHACRIKDLPHWLGRELWAIELEGEVLAAPDAVVARRGRLVERIDAWSGSVAQEFGDHCARRATDLASGNPSVAGRASDARADTANGWISAAAYVAAAVAGEVGSGLRAGPLYQHHFLAERTRQSWWLEHRLKLRDG